MGVNVKKRVKKFIQSTGLALKKLPGRKNISKSAQYYRPRKPILLTLYISFLRSSK